MTVGVLTLAASGLDSTPAQAAVIGGVEAGATVTFECSTRAVSGTAHTMYSMEGAGVLALAWVYENGSWTNAGAWVPADGIHQFVVAASNPYRYASIQYARYVNGWQYDGEWAPMAEPDINGGAFCR